MPGEELKLPFYAKTTIFFVGVFALIAMLYISKTILIPIVFAFIIAIVLHPVVNFFVGLRINRVVAIVLTSLLAFLVIAALGTLLISKLSSFFDEWPSLVERFTTIINQTIADGAEYFNKDPQKIHAWITKTQGEIISSSSAAIGQTIVIFGDLLVALFLLPVYIFLILFYQPILIEFIRRLFGADNKIKVSKIVTQTKTVIQQYLVGLLIEFVILAAMEVAVLLLLGIEYAIMLGIIGALLNVIPYIGGIIAVILPMLVAFVINGSPLYALYVLIAYYIIQLIDNNYIVPKIVASKVKINALFSIIAVIAGNALWGIPGMFLSIPILAIIKLVCDNIEPLKPWGFLLGDTMPPILKIKLPFKKTKNIIPEDISEDKNSFSS